jgi:predicted AAA+ superfamily ATPase
MPHERPRFLAPLAQKALTHSPIVGILGQRQVGKTTLLQSLSAEYHTLDRASTLTQARADAEMFLRDRRAPCGVDEAQLCPELFPAAKEHVRLNPRRGQFLFSGSVRFTSRKAIRESLTGRIVSLDLLPFTIAEAQRRPLPHSVKILLRAHRAPDLQSLARQGGGESAFTSYLRCGGLPGICFHRDAHVRDQRFAAHLDTLLNRDLQLIYPTTLPDAPLRALLRYLASTQGQPFNAGEASRRSEISRVTLRRILQAFEGLLLIRPVESVGMRGPVYFLEDQGLASWLTGTVLESADDLLRGVYANLRQEIHYRPEWRGRISQWRTYNDVTMPLVIASTQGKLGIIPTLAGEPTPKILGSAKAFLKSHPGAKVAVACAGDQFVQRAPDLCWIPYWALC